MALATNLGFPNIGAGRELPMALERHWRTGAAEALDATAAELRHRHWAVQRRAGIEQLPAGDFSLFDRVLDTAVMVGAVPERYLAAGPDRAAYFAMARGRPGLPPLARARWFDSGYQHVVPELAPGQRFSRGPASAVEHFGEAVAAGLPARPVLLGPVSFLLLAGGPGRSSPGARLEPLTALIEVYADVLTELARAGAAWIQIDEPCLATDLGGEAHVAFLVAYHRLARAADVRLLLTTYFAGLGDNLAMALRLPVAGLHLDLVSDPAQLGPALDIVPDRMALSLGVVDGRNVWRTDLDAALRLLEQAARAVGPDRVMVAPSCSLLHVPIDLDLETGLDPGLRPGLAFAVQKLREVAVLARGVDQGRAAIAAELDQAAAARAARRQAGRRTPAVAERLARIAAGDYRRAGAAPARRAAQAGRLDLPPLPTTTVGSFPPSQRVEGARAAHRRGELDRRGYEAVLWAEIDRAIAAQAEAGIDVPTAGVFERGDPVEHVAERLDGIAVTRAGWVQRYGADCARPPIVHGDVARPGPMTVEWARAAQARTERPLKPVLPGPVTLLRSCFARDDEPAWRTCAQLALALRDELADLERAGLALVQVDEPALADGLPLHAADADAYLNWAVGAFRLATCGLRDSTQLHAHVADVADPAMVEVLAALDADVLLVSPTGPDLPMTGPGWAAWTGAGGPGLVAAGVADLGARLAEAMAALGPERLWVSPGAGLAALGWDGLPPALAALAAAVDAARASAGAAAVREPQSAPHRLVAGRDGGLME